MIYKYDKVIKQYKELSLQFSLAEISEITHAPIHTLQILLKGVLKNREPDIREKIVSLYNNGASEREIAEMHAMSQASISKILCTSKVLSLNEREENRREDNGFIETLLQQISIFCQKRKKEIGRIYDYRDVLNQYRRLFLSDMPLKVLHVETGAPIRTLQRIVRPVVPQKKAEVAKKLVLCYREGLTQSEIGRRIKKSQGTVHNVLLELQHKLDLLNYHNYIDSIDQIVSHRYYDDSGGQVEYYNNFKKNEKNYVRIKQLFVIYKYKGNEKDMIRHVPSWRTIGHALIRINQNNSSIERYNFINRMPTGPVRVLIDSYKKTAKGSVLIDLPLKDIYELIDQHYYSLTEIRRRK